jgi:hypothetical protein
MRWGWELANAGKFCLALVGATVAAGLFAGWYHRKQELPPAQIVAMRFPLTVPASELQSDTGLSVGPSPPFQLASTTSMFARSALAQATYGYVESTAVNIRAAAPRREPRAPKSALNSNDRDRLFNDAQLASIEARLKLTADQRLLWEPVESALRAIRWSHARREAGHNAPDDRSLDLNSEELKALKTVATALIVTLRADQKDEVRTLTRLMGLGQLASQI